MRVPSTSTTAVNSVKKDAHMSMMLWLTIRMFIVWKYMYINFTPLQSNILVSSYSAVADWSKFITEQNSAGSCRGSRYHCLSAAGYPAPKLSKKLQRRTTVILVVVVFRIIYRPVTRPVLFISPSFFPPSLFLPSSFPPFSLSLPFCYFPFPHLLFPPLPWEVSLLKSSYGVWGAL